MSEVEPATNEEIRWVRDSTDRSQPVPFLWAERVIARLDGAEAILKRLEESFDRPDDDDGRYMLACEARKWFASREV